MFTLTSSAQKLTIFDAETGKPIEMVTVFNEDKTKTGITDADGSVDVSIFSKDEYIYFTHIIYSNCSEQKKALPLNDFKVYLSRESENLDEIVVSVFKNKSKVKRIPEQIAIVKKEEITMLAPQTSADVLANIPGIKVQKSQFGGGSPILRGMESNRVLLVVDGVRMNNAIYRKGHLQNSITVSPNLLDRTEVVFGPSSVIYGSDALGGVIHYYTKTPKVDQEKNSNVELLSRFSSVNFETTNQASLELSFPKWASFTSISYSDFEDLRMGKNRAHGFDDWGKVFYYSENSEDDYFENQSENKDYNIQRNTGYNQLDVLQKFYVPITSNTDFKLNFQYSTSSNIPRFDRLTEIVDDGTLKFAEWYYGPQQRLLISPQLDINPKKKILEKGTLTFAYQNIKESRVQRRFGSLEKSFREENLNIYSVNGDFLAPVAKNRNLGYGFEVVYNDVQSDSYGKTLVLENNQVIGFDDDLDFAVQSRYADGGSSYFTAAAYVEYRQDLSEKSTLNTGARFTYTNLKAKWLDESFITLPDNSIGISNQSVTATIGYVFKPNKNLQLNAVLSSGFRSPNIDDVGKVREKNGDVTVPNIHLKPEYAYNGEVGIQQFFNDKKFRIGVSAYYTLLRNYIYREAFTLDGEETILYDGELGNIVANVNKGNAYVTGFTASYYGKLHQNWKTSGSLTFTKGRTYDTDLPMSSIPPLFGNFDVSYEKNKLEAGVNLRFNAKKDIEDYNLEEGIDNQNQTPIANVDTTEDSDVYYGTPAWMTWGIYGRYNVNDNITLQARVNNVFDVHYKEFASAISAPGRDFSLSLFVNF